MTEFINTGLSLRYDQPQFTVPDPTDPWPIDPPAEPEVPTTGFLCDPLETAPTADPVIPAVVQVSTITYVCEIDSLGVITTLPVESVRYSKRGCYVSTPNTLTVTVPASSDLSEDLEAMLEDGFIYIKRIRKTVDGALWVDELVSANFDEWSMVKSSAVWEFELRGEQVVQYKNPAYRTVLSVVSESGDFDDYASDKVFVMVGWEASLVSPNDHIEHDGKGLYADLLVCQISSGGFEVVATQYGRVFT